VSPENKKIKAKINSTIIPRTSSDSKEDGIESDRYYIWRTALDHKVRKKHLDNEGKIFDNQNPPPTGNPGKDYNCRCEADYFITDWVEIDKPVKKELMYGYIPITLNITII
jgi:SPP1 gp7 family putative phage head morphogenesis protein